MEIAGDIYIIPGHGLNSNVYVFIDDNNFFLVDTGLPNNFDYIMSELNRMTSLNSTPIKAIILTHEHFDHIGATSMFLYAYSPAIYASLWTAKAINDRNTSVILSNFSPFEVNFKVMNILENNQEVKLGRYTFKVIHTPGHTLGSICLYSKRNRILISGDTVFANGMFGRFDLPTGNYNDLRNTLEKLTKLKVDILLPGHGPPVYSNGDQAIMLAYNNLISFY